ncbi:MAG TPA: VIT1/CCC1 transporter family protein, partial [Usitatibacter sp.]|nr:VIT1/CCC1 transporter family protein [Usitatibacter sp.]
LARERRELKTDAHGELEELARIYEKRGLDRGLAKEVARQLTEHDALAAHARDELGMSKSSKARPLQAAMASALSFAAGGAFPLLVVAVSPHDHVARIVGVAALVALAGLGALSARQSGAPMTRAVARVTSWSALALAVTAGVGALFGVSG